MSVLPAVTWCTVTFPLPTISLSMLWQRQERTTFNRSKQRLSTPRRPSHTLAETISARYTSRIAVSLTIDKTARERILGEIAAAYHGLGMLDAARDGYSIVAVTSPHQWVRWQATINLMELAVADCDESQFDTYVEQLSTAALDLDSIPTRSTSRDSACADSGATVQTKCCAAHATTPQTINCISSRSRSNRLSSPPQFRCPKRRTSSYHTRIPTSFGASRRSSCNSAKTPSPNRAEISEVAAACLVAH